jgi:heat shock protein HtpX
MIFAPIMAQFIYLAISRKREYLADASSALYTRYPEGLASALEKIGASTEQLKSANNATAPMYILNPFRKNGRAAEDLSSTHPPISERIRILRAMAGNVSLAGYESAYNQAHKGGGGIIPGSALAAVDTAIQRSAVDMGVAPAEKERAREASDVLWKLHKYQEITCNCGLKFKLPPDFHSDSFPCPRCGTVHSL